MTAQMQTAETIKIIIAFHVGNGKGKSMPCYGLLLHPLAAGGLHTDSAALCHPDPVPVLPQPGKTQHCGTIEDGMILLQGDLNLPAAKKYEIDMK